MTEAEFDKVMAVNVKSVFLGSNAFTAQVKKQGTGGVMVNIASVGAHRPRPGLVWYNASKSAIANVGEALDPSSAGSKEASTNAMTGRPRWDWLQSMARMEFVSTLYVP